MSRETLISVIVPVYNVERYLARCVDSILAQTYENLQIILVDDGATDASGNICDEYAAKDSRITVIHKKNGGLSSARNAGIEAARGEYLAFVDSDDWIEPEMYACLLALLKKYDAELVCAGRYDVNGTTGEKKNGLCPREEACISGEEMVGKIFLWDGCDSSACDKLYHRSLFETFRYPEGKVCEDVPTTYRIVLQAARAVLCKRRFYNYYHRVGSISMAAAITEKTFHFSEHTASIYPYIRENYPNIEPQARYLRVRSLSHILLLLEQADSAVRERFCLQYRRARQDLRKHTGFILKSPYFGSKEKITNLLLVLGLYRLLRPIFHRA
ncbi:MAG: glycosyltransferase [Oscillospiraceae bacterium]|nr:glycosyltransferase [Oscillospiraceae bacterium]